MFAIYLRRRTIALLSLGFSLGLISVATTTAQVRTVALTEADAGTRPGEFFDQFLTLHLNDSGNVSFGATLQNGEGTLVFNDNFGIWHSANGQLRNVTRLDVVSNTDPVFGPCGRDDVHLTNDDRTLFPASDAVVAIDSVFGFSCANPGLWAENQGALANVIDRSVPLDGSGGAMSTYELGHGSNKIGAVVFESGPLGFERGIWSGEGATTRLILTSDAVVPAINNETATFSFAPFAVFGDHYFINELGNVTIRGEARFADGRRRQGIWLDDGRLQLVAMAGGPITDSPDGPIFHDSFFPETFSEVQVADDGILFAALAERGVAGITADNDEGLYAYEKGAIRPIAIEGEPAPGTELVFDGGIDPRPFPESAANRSGDSAFIASVGFSGQGVWAERDGQLELVLLATLPRLSDVAINGNGQVAFLQSGVGLLAENVAGELLTIAELGQPFEVAPGDFRTLTTVDFGSNAGFNELGQIAFTATFSDGTSGVFVSDMAMVPEPMAWCTIAWCLLLASAMRPRWATCKTP